MTIIGVDVGGTFLLRHIFHVFDTRQGWLSRLANELDLVGGVPRQGGREMPELPGTILVHEQELHRSKANSPLVSRKEVRTDTKTLYRHNPEMISITPELGHYLRILLKLSKPLCRPGSRDVQYDHCKY